MNEVEALVEHMKAGTGEDDPYWLLFECKEAVNDSIVNAYGLGFKRGYRASEKYSKSIEDSALDYANRNRALVPVNPTRECVVDALRNGFADGRLSGLAYHQAKINSLKQQIIEYQEDLREMRNKLQALE